MKEIVLSIPGGASPYPKELQEAPATVMREGREYTKYSLAFAIRPLKRVVKLVQSAVALLFTGMLILISSDFRSSLRALIRGKESLIILSPVVIKEIILPPIDPIRPTLPTIDVNDDEGMSASETSSSEEDDFLNFDYSASLSGLLNFGEGSLKELYHEAHEAILSKEEDADIKKKMGAYISKSLENFENAPEWQEIRDGFDAFKENGGLERSEWLLFFYKAVSIAKDYKISNHDKVEEKLCRFIELGKATQVGLSPTRALDKTEEFFDVGGYKGSVCSAKGERPAMEDEHAACVLKTASAEIPYFAVFDGHGGNECSLFLKENLMQFIRKEFVAKDLKCPIVINTALAQAFVKANAEYAQNGGKQGSTGIVALIIGTKLWVVNAGDSRAIINKGGEVIQLSKDHKATDKNEQARVKKRGGKILGNRVNASLAVTRTFGDIGPGISARPDIKCYDLVDLEDSVSNQLIIACDGVFDVLDSSEVVKIADGKSVEEAADLIRQEAFNKGTKDNVTVMVINLNK